MMMKKLILVLVFAGLVASLVVGCTPKDPRAKNLVHVTGTVLLDGKPLPEASLIFTPAEGNVYQIAGSAYSKNDGTFHVTTYLAGDGIHPGHYSVTVFKEKSILPISQEKAAALEAEGKSLPEPLVKNLIPSKYNTKETSGLLVEIPANGTKNLRIELQSIQ